jgi:hypothetical protein
MRNNLLLIAAMMCVTIPAECERRQSFYDSGNAFARECSSMNKQTTEMTGAEINEGVKCAVYVKGLFDGIQAERTRLLVTDPAKASPAFFCEEKFNEVENGQIVRILLKYIRDNPDKAEQPVAALFMFAMRDAFPPCASQKS